MSLTAFLTPMAGALTAKDGVSIVLGILLGLFFLAAAWFRWSWFFQDRAGDDVTPALGVEGARIFYALLGLFTVGGMVYFLIRG